jgi:DNA-binding PadR family transcriptional regulator
MVSPAAPDPVRSTLLAILKQLNQADRVHEGKTEEQALELSEIEERLSDFTPVQRGKVKVALALGLLLRNGLVRAQGNGSYSWQRQRAARQLYQITPEGKKFLVDALQATDRVL